MEIFSIIATALAGGITSFFMAAVAFLNTDEIKSTIEKNSGKARRLYELKLHFEDNLNSFQIIEIGFYLISASIGGGYIIEKFGGWMYLLYSLPVYFLLLIVIKYLFYSLGIKFANTVSVSFTGIISFISYVLSPLVNVLAFMIRRISGHSIDDVSREEINAMFESAREDGSLDADEYRILKNIMHFSEVYVSDVMTPRTVLFSCQADKTVGEVANLPELQMYSRFPIWEGESLDNKIVGYVMSKDVLFAALQGNNSKKIKDFARHVYFIPENAELDIALDKFLNRRQHLFVVVDEYGGVEGLLTMEDVLETMLGAEIVDEADKVVDLRLLAKQRRDKRISLLTNK